MAGSAVFDVHRVRLLQRPMTVRCLLGMVPTPAPPAPAAGGGGGGPPPAAPAAPAARTLAQDQPIIFGMALKVSEATGAAGLPELWRNYNNLQRGQHQNALEMAFAVAAADLGLPHPLITPARATNFQIVLTSRSPSHHPVR